MTGARETADTSREPGDAGSWPRDGRGSARLAAMFGQDLRWAFTRPFSWLVGIGVNLVLSVVYLVWVPLSGGSHDDWAILVGTYFAVFVLADVTSTNVLGVDAERTRLRLRSGVRLGEVLLVKNLVLLAVVGLPVLVTTGIITAYGEPEHRLELTLPGVLYPILTWLGIGNVVSVLMPYAPLPLATRWARRRSVGSTSYWVVCLALPYVLCVAVEQLKRLPRIVTTALGLPVSDLVRGMVLVVLGLVVWALGSATALRLTRRRGVSLDGSR